MDHQHTGLPARDGIVVHKIAGQYRGTLLVVDPLGFHGGLRRAGLQHRGGDSGDYE